MDDRFMVCEINCETGETVYRPYTAEEAAVHAETIAAYEAVVQANEQVEQAKAAARASAAAKLAALGLTTEEIAALQ
jgi:hypothetical protein